MRIGQLCGKESEKSDSASGGDLVQFVLSAIYFQLKHVKLVDITLEWLQAQVPVLLMRRNIVSTVRDLVTDLDSEAARAQFAQHGAVLLRAFMAVVLTVRRW